MDKGLKRKLNTGLVLAFIVGLWCYLRTRITARASRACAVRRRRIFLFTLDGKPTKLSDLSGKVVLVNFWATWCPPCVEETPSLNELQRRIAPRGGMVLGVSEDDDQQAYDEFLKANQIRFPTFRDTSKQIPAQYGTSMYPDTYVIRRDGKLDRKIVGTPGLDQPGNDGLHRFAARREVTILFP